MILLLFYFDNYIQDLNFGWLFEAKFFFDFSYNNSLIKYSDNNLYFQEIPVVKSFDRKIFVDFQKLTNIYYQNIPENYFDINNLLFITDVQELSRIYEIIFNKLPEEDIKKDYLLMQEIILQKIYSIKQENFLFFWNKILIDNYALIKNFEITEKQAEFLMLFLYELFISGLVDIQIFFTDSFENNVSNFFVSVSEARKILIYIESEILQNKSIANNFLCENVFDSVANHDCVTSTPFLVNIDPFSGNFIYGDKLIRDSDINVFIKLMHSELDYLESSFIINNTDYKVEDRIVNLFDLTLKSGELNYYFYIYPIKLRYFIIYSALIPICFWLIWFFIVGGLTFDHCFRPGSVFRLWYLETFLPPQIVMVVCYIIYLFILFLRS